MKKSVASTWLCTALATMVFAPCEVVGVEQVTADATPKQANSSEKTIQESGPSDNVQTALKRVDDFSVEVINPNLNRSSKDIGMQVLHAQSHFKTEIPDEEEDLLTKEQLAQQNKSSQKGDVAKVLKRRQHVVTGTQQELQAGVAALSLLAKEQERKAQQAEALTRAENQKAQQEAEAKAKEQAALELVSQTPAINAKPSDELKTEPSQGTATKEVSENQEVKVAEVQVSNDIGANEATDKDRGIALGKASAQDQGAKNAILSSTKEDKVKTISVQELASKFPLPKKPKISKEKYLKVDLMASAGTYHVASGTGTYRIALEIYKEGQGYTKDQLLTAIYRRNASKFGNKGPLYPFDEVDLVLPTVEQIKLEKEGVFARYLSQKGMHLSVDRLPPLDVSSNENTKALAQYEKDYVEVMRKREAYLADNGLQLESAKNGK